MIRARAEATQDVAADAGHAFPRRLPVGAECVGERGVDFRLWAPRRRRVDVVIEGGPGEGSSLPCDAEAGGYFRAQAREAGRGSLYRLRLDGGAELFPDPASRAQPSGPHGPSEVVDPRFAWSDGPWRGVESSRPVIYELHVGTFTPAGTWRSATLELEELANLGVTTIEVMPIAEFPGRFGWGYDGVNLFAPSHLYGPPDDMRRFVDRAHRLGLGVILDVVYNHLGPDGNYLPQFSDSYFHPTNKTDWGAALNYDAAGSAAVRELVVSNARHWIEEYHLDGLRLDATQDIFDTSDDHIVAAVGRATRAAAAGRRVFLVAENEPQSATLVRSPGRGGYGLDALWNDDLHHAAHVALTGHAEAYYSDYGGTPQELVSAAKHGFLYQGQHYAWQGKARGAPALDLSPHQLVCYLENHDQVANSATGARLHAVNPARHRALATMVLLSPTAVLLFQGEEFASSRPFAYFADHEAELAAKVEEGRRRFLAQFPSLASPEAAKRIPPPGSMTTFESCKLDFAERSLHAPMLAFYRDMLALRRDDAVFGQAPRRPLDGAVLTPHAFVLRFFGPRDEDRLVVVNLGPDVRLERLSEPLLAPPAGSRWRRLLSSEDPRYGGLGVPSSDDPGRFRLLGESAVVLRSSADGAS